MRHLHAVRRSAEGFHPDSPADAQHAYARDGLAIRLCAGGAGARPCFPDLSPPAGRQRHCRDVWLPFRPVPLCAAGCRVCGPFHLFLRRAADIAPFLSDDFRLRGHGSLPRPPEGGNGRVPWLFHHDRDGLLQIAPQPGKKRRNEGSLVMDALILSCGTGGGHDSKA